MQTSSRKSESDMETKEEKPTMYIITGHRGSGKTSQIADLLPDHPFIPHVQEVNKVPNQLMNEYLQTGQSSSYIMGSIKAELAADDYIEKQMANQENIYLEINATKEIYSFDHPIQDKYHLHSLFVMCDSPQQTVDRIKANYEPVRENFNPANVVKKDYHRTNEFMSKYMYTNVGRMDIVDGSGNKPVLMATLTDGKVTYANPNILEKDWFLKANRQLDNRIINHINNQQQKISEMRRSVKPAQTTAAPERRKRIKL